MFLRILKQKNKTTVSYKMAVVEAFRENGKVRHRMVLYVGTFPEKHRDKIEYRRRFIKKFEQKLLGVGFTPNLKDKFRQKLYDILPEIEETRKADRELERQRPVRNKIYKRV